MRWFEKTKGLVAADARVSVLVGLGIRGSPWKIICAGPILAGTEGKVEALINKQLLKKKKGFLSSKVISEAKKWAAKLPVPADVELSGGLHIQHIFRLTLLVNWI